MDRTVAGLSLLELTVTIVLLAILGVPLGRMVAGQMQASVQTDGMIAATNLARYEQERTLAFFDANLTNWCSALSVEPWCTPAVVTPPNPYDGLAYNVTRHVDPQQPTDSSETTWMKRITVKVFRQGETTPLMTLVTYRATGDVSFGP